MTDLQPHADVSDLTEEHCGGVVLSRRTAVGLVLPAAAFIVAGCRAWNPTKADPSTCGRSDESSCTPVSIKESRFAGGAKGDGRADDSRAVQAAIDAATTIFVPAGTYRLATPLTVPSDRRIFGVGNASVLKKADQMVNRLIVNADPKRGNRNIIIEKLAIDGSRSGRRYIPLKDGICLTRCTGALLREVTVRNCLNDGIIIEYGSSNRVSRCTLHGNVKNGIYSSGSRSIMVDENDAYGNLLGGIAIAATRGGKVAHNRCGGNRVDILLARDSRFISVTSNECLSDTALAVSPETIGGGLLNGVAYPRKPAVGWDRVYGASSCTIQTNHFDGQVRLILFNDGEFADNICEGSAAQGLLLQGASRNRIATNTIRGWTPPYGGIQIAPLMASDGVPAIQHPPILSNDNIVVDNRLYPVTSAQTVIIDQGLRNQTTKNYIERLGS